MIELRPYQEQAIQAVRASLRKQMAKDLRPSAILEAPTGSGKTAMAAFIAQSTQEKGGSVAFICHRKELIDQTALTFDKLELEYGFIAADYPLRSAPVQICSVGTLVNRVDSIPAPTVCIWDECHHVGAKTWRHVRKMWLESIHIGLSATPARLDGKGLGSWFNALVPGPKVSDLMADGYLSTYDAYAPIVPDMKGIHKRGGDYAKGEMESSLGTGEILGGIVENWKKYAKGKKTIGFAITVKHSKSIVAAFVADGIRAAHLDAQSPKAERRAMLQAFARGEIEVLFNVDLFGEGFDLAANSGMDVTIEAVILARPTASIGLHRQQVGRGLRQKDEPAIILDHAGNLLRHGLPDDEIEWSLEDKDLREVDAGPKLCRECFAVVARHLTICPMCGYVFPPPDPREIKEVIGDLQKIVSGAETAEQLQLELRRRNAEVRQASTLDHLLEIQRSRRLPEGWAEKVMAGRRKAGRRL